MLPSTFENLKRRKISGGFKGATRGFTLVEVLIIVAILGIMLIFVAPALTSAVEDGDYVECQSNLEMIKRAKSTYIVDHLGVSSDGELAPVRHVFLDPVSLTTNAERGAFRAYFPERFSMVCPRNAASVYTNTDHLYQNTLCPHCQANPR